MAAKKQPRRAPASKAPASRAAAPGPAGNAPKPAQPAPTSSPAGLAAVLGMGVGALLVINGVSVAFASGLERVSYWLGVLIVGPLLVATSWLMMRGRRTGWAFFVGITGPAALATFFGAPTIRKVVADVLPDSGAALQWTLALVPMLVFATLCVLASVDHARFEDADS